MGLSLQGQLLLATPTMRDEHFMHSVVLVCQHDENGAFGVTVNRPSPGLVSDAFPDHGELGTSPLRLWNGGPVAPTALQILHRLPEGVALSQGDLEEIEPEGQMGQSLPAAGVEIVPGVRLGADLDGVAQFASGRAEADLDGLVRFVVGYSGWGAGQLDAEMETGSWLPVPATPELVFAPKVGEALWRLALGSVPGGDGLAHLPPDPSWN